MGEDDVVISSELIVGIVSTGIISLIGWLLGRSVGKIDEAFDNLWAEIKQLHLETNKHDTRLTIVETHLNETRR